MYSTSRAKPVHGLKAGPMLIGHTVGGEHDQTDVGRQVAGHRVADRGGQRLDDEGQDQHQPDEG